jgi:hypothetical protein
VSGFEIIFGTMALGLCGWVLVVALGEYARKRPALRPGSNRHEGLTPVQQARAEARLQVEAPGLSGKPADGATVAPETESERIRREAREAGLKSVLADVKDRKPVWRRLGGDD